jgi:thiamine-phosphate pyrophosphorylase
MPNSETPRLFLITPSVTEARAFAATLEATLAAADVAAVLIPGSGDERRDLEVASALVPLVQSAGAAALIGDDTRILGRSKADGVHITTGIGDLRAASRTLRPQRIVGAGGLRSRHAAMEAGEAEPDYVFFGDPRRDTHDAPHPNALDLAAWWSELMTIPAVIMAGRSLAGVADAAATGASFVALRDAVWSHPQGPSAALRLAAAELVKTSKVLSG